MTMKMNEFEEAEKLSKDSQNIKYVQNYSKLNKIELYNMTFLDQFDKLITLKEAKKISEDCEKVLIYSKDLDDLTYGRFEPYLTSAVFIPIKFEGSFLRRKKEK